MNVIARFVGSTYLTKLKMTLEMVSFGNLICVNNFKVL